MKHNESKRITLCSFLLLAILCVGAIEAASANPTSTANLSLTCKAGTTPQERNVPLGREFTIKFGEQVVLAGENVRITFAEILNDSRCPPNAVCIWQGNARLRFDFTNSRSAILSAEINTTRLPVTQDLNPTDYDIKIVALNDPRAAATGSHGYVATLIVTPKRQPPTPTTPAQKRRTMRPRNARSNP